MRQKIVVSFVVILVVVLSSAFFSSGLLSPSTASANELDRPMSVGSLSPLIHVSHLLGTDQSNRTLHMSVGLALRHRDQLTTLLQGLYNPASPDYHHFLTVDEFAQEFGPTADQQQAVITYLTQRGFTVTQTYATHQLIDFSGPESLAEQVFGVSVNTYRGPDGRDFFANASVPAIPARIASSVTFIGGLDNANQFYHPPITSRTSRLGSNAASNCPAASQTAYIPSQLSAAYNYDGLHKPGLFGQGQTVGVFELDGYSASDVQAYTQCFGGGNVPVSNVVLDGFNGQPGAGAIEVELDMEVILSMAPKLGKLLVYEAPNTTQGYNDEFARIVSDRTPVVSVSWGDCEPNMGQQEVNQENTFFQEAAAQGQSILVASGDSGSASCFQFPSNFDISLAADDPAAQPYVTAVGGTTLSLNSNNSYQSEHVWNGGFLGGAGGGGISQFWKQPSWQTGPGVQNSYSNGMREYPDVSLNADPATGYPIYCTAGSSCSGSGGWVTVGGTSAAAPMWAAMVALANQEAAQHGKKQLGFLNPALYKVGGGSNYGRDFHDITPPTDTTTPSNNDEIGLNGGAYPVTTGFDMATGWGTFDATKLASDLIG